MHSRLLFHSPVSSPRDCLTPQEMVVKHRIGSVTASGILRSFLTQNDIQSRHSSFVTQRVSRETNRKAVPNGPSRIPLIVASAANCIVAIE